MRIAAGIVLIVAALVNGCGGIASFGFGAAGAVVGKAGSSVSQAVEAKMAEQGQTMDAKNKAEFEKGMGKLQAAGGSLMVFGVFLFVMLGLQIGAAVVLFMQKAKGFVMVVAVLGIIAEIVGIVLKSSFVWWQVFGIIGSILAIVAAMGYGKSQAPAAPAAAA